jgi:hypothetical protein
MSFMLNALNGSIQAELIRFFNVIDDSYLSTKSVSTVVFCKAGMKFTQQAFIELNNDTYPSYFNLQVLAPES